MKNGQLKFINRDTRDHSAPAFAMRQYSRIKNKTLKHILLDRFLNQYGYDKGAVTAQAIVDDLLGIVEQYYRFTDNSFLKQGQMVWPAVPIDEYPRKGKSMAQTKLKPVVLDIICEDDIEALRTPIYYRDMRMKKIERWTHQAYDQGALLSQLDLAMLLGVKEQTAGIYTREYFSTYGKPLPTRGNVQLLGSGQTHKQEIIGLYLEGYLVPTICQKTNHSKEAVERYIRDFEAIRMLHLKFDDLETISLITRLSQRVVNQYVDLIPMET